MARKGNNTNASIVKTSGKTGNRLSGGGGKGGNASIAKSTSPSKRTDMKNLTTGSDIKKPRSSGYDPGMHK